MAWRSFLFGIIGLAVSAALIYFAKPLAKTLLAGFGIQTEDTRPLVATAIKTSGRVYFRASGKGSYSKLKADQKLYQRDEIKTERGSKLHLKFNSNYEIEVLELSQAILDIWSSNSKRQPEYISFLRGDYRLLSKGKPGYMYIVFENEVFAPELRPETSDKSFKIDTEATASNSVQTEPEALPDTAPTQSEVKNETKMPDKISGRGSETLSSAYIESVFLSRAPLFRRCQLTSVRDNKMAVGNMLFSLVIKPNGRVSGVKLLQKNLDNSSLESCVSSVIERTKFKPFQGTAISLSYPLNFQ